MTSQILTIHRILSVRAKNRKATLLFVDFTKAFDSIHRGKMEQILLAYGISKENVAAIMMLYRNMKVKVYSPDVDTDYFDIVAGVLQGDTLVLYLFIICLDYVLRTSINLMKENGFKLTKERSRRYPVQTTTYADYTDNIALLANTSAQAESLLHSLERAAGGMGLRVNVDKIEYMCSNQRSDIYTLKGGLLKLVDKFTYQGSSVSSTETDINTRLAKTRTAIDRQSVIWKSNRTDKIKRSFFQSAVVSILLYGCTTWMQNVWRKSLTAITKECCEQYWTSSEGSTPQNSSCTATYHLSRKLSKLDEPDMRDTVGKVRTNSQAMYSCGLNWNLYTTALCRYRM